MKPSEPIEVPILLAYSLIKDFLTIGFVVTNLPVASLNSSNTLLEPLNLPNKFLFIIILGTNNSPIFI